MESVLPIFFAVLAAAVLLAGLLALWQSLRATFGVTQLSGASLGAETATIERRTLLDEKASLLNDIKDLEFEHDVGKLSDEDYGRLDEALRSRARDVLRLLDADLGPFREQAEQLVRSHLERELGEAGPYRAAAEHAEDAEPPTGEAPETKPAPEAKAAAEPEATDEPKAAEEPETDDEPKADPKPEAKARVCAACETVNDLDAKFCKECAKPLATEKAEEEK